MADYEGHVIGFEDEIQHDGEVYLEKMDPAEPQEPAPGPRLRFPLSEFFGKIDRGEYIPLETGIDFIDDLTGGGFIPGTITMIVADPGAGKTSLCQQLAGQFARNGYQVAFINYEMDEGQLFARDLSREVEPPEGRLYDPRFHAGAILRGDMSTARHSVAVTKYKRFREAVAKYEAEIYPNLFYNPYIPEEDENGLPTDNYRPIRNTAKDLRVLTRLKLFDYQERRREAEAAGEDLEKVHAAILFIDYIQLIATGSDSKINALEEITGILADYAKAGNTLVFAVSSASKESRKNTQPKTRKTDDEDEEETPQEKEDPNAPGRPIAVYCDKARFGTPGRVAHVRFIGAASKFIIPAGYTGTRYAGEFEKMGYLCKSSANGASVLEYSAAYFLSLNDDRRPHATTSHQEPTAPASTLAEISAELEETNSAWGNMKKLKKGRKATTVVDDPEEAAETVPETTPKSGQKTSPATKKAIKEARAFLRESKGREPTTAEVAQYIDKTEATVKRYFATFPGLRGAADPDGGEA